MANEQTTIANTIAQNGEDITFVSNTSTSYSEDDGWTQNYTSGTTIKGIPYNHVNGKIDYRTPGNDAGVTTQVIIDGISVTPKEQDRVVWLGVTYLVAVSEPLRLKGDYLGYLLTLNKEL